VHFDAVFKRQKTRTAGQSLEALGHGIHDSSVKRSLQKQCKNYPKIHGQIKGAHSRHPFPWIRRLLCLIL